MRPHTIVITSNDVGNFRIGWKISCANCGCSVDFCLNIFQFTSESWIVKLSELWSGKIPTDCDEARLQNFVNRIHDE